MCFVSHGHPAGAQAEARACVYEGTYKGTQAKKNWECPEHAQRMCATLRDLHE